MENRVALGGSMFMHLDMIYTTNQNKLLPLHPQGDLPRPKLHDAECHMRRRADFLLPLMPNRMSKRFYICELIPVVVVVVPPCSPNPVSRQIQAKTIKNDEPSVSDRQGKET